MTCLLNYFCRTIHPTGVHRFLPQYPQIDVMFRAIRMGCSWVCKQQIFNGPIEYLYNEWAGFYHEGPQQLYVNGVGFGFLFPGRSWNIAGDYDI